VFYRYNIYSSIYNYCPFVVLSLLNFKDKSTLLSIYNAKNGKDENNKKKEVEENKVNKENNYIKRAHGISIGPLFFDRETKPSSLIPELNNNTFFFDLKDDNEKFFIKENFGTL